MFYNLSAEDFDCGCPTGRSFVRNEQGFGILRCRDCESLDIREFLAGNSEHSAQLLAKKVRDEDDAETEIEAGRNDGIVGEE